MINNLKYQFSSGEVVLFDTNILIGLYLPSPISQDEEKASYSSYSTIEKNARSANSQLIISPLTLSEYINQCYRRFAKFRGRIDEHGRIDKIEYRRNKKQFGDDMQTIIDSCEGILRNFSYREYPSKTEVECGFKSLKDKQLEFTDAVIAEYCTNYKITLVTNDADFKSYKDDLNIVSVNPKMR